MFVYKKTEKEKINHLFEAAYDLSNCVYDSAFENNILNSDFYKMKYDKKEIGYFSVLSESTLTQFYIKEEFRHLGQGCFKRVLSDLNITSALVATCDIFFINSYGCSKIN